MATLWSGPDPWSLAPGSGFWVLVTPPRRVAPPRRRHEEGWLGTTSCPLFFVFAGYVRTAAPGGETPGWPGAPEWCRRRRQGPWGALAVADAPPAGPSQVRCCP